MKKLIILLGTVLTSLLGCKKDSIPKEPVSKFQAATRDVISVMDNSIITANFFYDKPAVPNFKVGSIIFFKTNLGNYGKMEVVSVSNTYELVLNIVTFAQDGSKIVDKSNFTCTSSSTYDLDQAEVPEDNSAADFSWYIISTYHNIGFINPSKGYLYSI